MPANIKCPNCNTVIDVENVLSADAEQKIKLQYEKQLQQSLSLVDTEKRKLEEREKIFEETRKKENEIFQQKLQQEKIKLETEIQQQVRKSVAGDYENQLKLLQQSNLDNEEKLKSSRQKELEYLKKEQELKTREQELEIILQKKLLEERNILSQRIRKEEENKIALKENQFQLERKEWEIQNEQQKKLINDLKRKSEQGSMQLQGETQELLLEDALKNNFPFDQITEVGKGAKGGDCIMTIRNHNGVECGHIIFESKRAKDFKTEWIEKLKMDMRQKGAEIGILVTAVYPKDFRCFGQKDGIWICTFSEVIALTHAMRMTVIRISETKKLEENKGEKMNQLYGFLTGMEFRQQIETIVEGFSSLKNSIIKEKMQMEKIWKEREKQLEKVLISTSGMYGSIKGIAGSSIGNIPLLENDIDEDEE